MDFSDKKHKLILDRAEYGNALAGPAFRMRLPYRHSAFEIDCRILENAVTRSDTTDYFAHPHPHYVRVWAFQQGEAVLRCETEELHLKTGGIYLLPPGLNFKICYSPRELIYYHLFINDSSGLSVFRAEDSVAAFHCPRLMEQFVRAAESRNVMDDYSALMALLAEVLPDRMEMIAERHESFREFREIFRFLSSHPPATVTLSQLAALYDIRESALSKRFRRKMGISLKHYLLDFLCRQASELLLFSDLKVQEVAERLGYANIQYFFRFFRRQTGMTPSEFRSRKGAVKDRNKCDE